MGRAWRPSSGTRVLIDLELGGLFPVVALELHVADARGLGDVLRQLGLRALEVLAGDVGRRGIVLERLDEDVLVRSLDAAGPVEEQVAGLGAGGLGELLREL